MQIKSKGFAHLILIIGVVLVGIVGIGYLIIKDSTSPNIIPDTYQQNDVDYWQCGEDSDCVIAINPKGCCYCPDSINKKYLLKDGWEEYAEGKSYNSQTTCDVVCEQCAIPGEAVCLNNKCTFKSEDKSLDTSGWKTYKNEEYGFKFKYPDEWEFFPIGLDTVFYFGEEYYPDSMFSISIYDKRDEPRQGNCTTVAVDNHEGELCRRRRHIETSHGVQTDYYYTSLEIIVSYNNKEYTIHYSGTDETIDDHTKTFNQILSTFKFTE